MSHKSNMTFTNKSLVSEVWSCEFWQMQLFSDKILSSPKITQEVKKFSWRSPKYLKHRTSHVVSQSTEQSQLPITLTFFSTSTAAFIKWPFQLITAKREVRKVRCNRLPPYCPMKPSWWGLPQGRGNSPYWKHGTEPAAIHPPFK